MTSPPEELEPVVEPGGDLRLHLSLDHSTCLCGMPINGRLWRRWGISYADAELDWAAGARICPKCIHEYRRASRTAGEP